MTNKIDSIVVTVGQSKATNFSREKFDTNESITLVNTTPREADLFRRVLRIKGIASVVVDMLAFKDIQSEQGMHSSDVEAMLRVSEAQLGGIKEFIRGEDSLSNKPMLVEMVIVAEDILNEIKTVIAS